MHQRQWCLSLGFPLTYLVFLFFATDKWVFWWKFCWFICWTCWIDLLLLLHLCPSPKQLLFALLLSGVNPKTFLLLHFFIRYTNLLISTKPLAFIPPSFPKATMGEPNTQKDIFSSPEKPERPSLLGTSSESSTPASTIPPARKMLSTPVSWLTQVNKKTLQDYKKDRAEKYAQYFQGNQILPIPELVEAVQPKTLSLIIIDIKTRRLAGLKKEKFEELLKAAGIPARYFCKHSFATWDILLPSQELARFPGNTPYTWLWGSSNDGSSGKPEAAMLAL